MEYLYVAGGLAGLFLGGEWLVRGSAAIARRLAMPPLLIGLTVVGFGTSTPELLVSVDAALRGVPDIAVGNVVGSNIANILLIIGLTALVWPVATVGPTLRRNTSVMMLAALALIPVFAMGSIGRVTGAVSVLLLAAYLVWAYNQAPPEDEVAATDVPDPPLWRSGAFVALGLVLLMVGARFLVTGAVSLARGFGLSEAFIGLTIVAVGTSLPELATSLIAAFRRHSEIALGNIVGSNIFNVLGILGLTAMIAPIPVASRFLGFDLPVLIAVSFGFALLLWLRVTIGRGLGAVLIVAYAAYVWTAQ